MNMIPVKSSASRSIGYDENAKKMSIMFAAGHTYDYCNVPRQVYEALLSAKLIGSYYNKYVKDRFPC